MANGSASGETYRNDLASDKERPLAEATTNTTTIIARADQHDIDLHKASDRVNFGSIREPIDVPYLLGVQTDSFDWLIGNERWQKRVEEDLANGTNTVSHTSGLDEVFQEISAERLYVHNRRENHWYCYKWASGRREIMFVEEVGGDLPLVMQVYPEL